MLTKQNILQLCENGSFDQKGLNSDLQEIVKRFPYFQSARLLQLKESKVNSGLDYEQLLKTTSAYATDRVKLYNYVIKEDLIKKIEQPVKDSTSTSTSTSKEGSVSVSTSSSVSDEKVERTGEEISSYEKKILEEAINLSIQQEIEDDIQELQVKPYEIKEIEEKSLPSSSMRSFSDWLKTSGKEVEIKSDDSKKIIDQFIDAEPKISPAKKDFFSPTNIGKLSLVDDEDFITETLAKIYVEQGAYEKAIRAFRNLSLKFPEKKSYFASRISDVEKLMNKK